MDTTKWKAQIRRGLIEYGLLNLVSSRERLYGLQIIEQLSQAGLSITEGTLYPLLSRLVREKILKDEWVTENTSGHPRKYYRLTKGGESLLKKMNEEWDRIVQSVDELRTEEGSG